MSFVLLGGVQDHRRRGFVASGQQGPDGEHRRHHGAEAHEEAQKPFATRCSEISAPNHCVLWRTKGGGFGGGRLGGIGHKHSFSDLAMA